MPVTKSAYTRYRVIDNLLNNKQCRFPSLEKMAKACKDKLGIEVSTSTIEKDITAMKESTPKGFSAPIVYVRGEKGYAYAEEGFSISGLNLAPEEWEALQYASKLFYQYKEVPVCSNFKSAIEKIDIGFNLGIANSDDLLSQYVQFEKKVSSSGYEWISAIYESLQNRYLLKISYENVYKNEVKQYEVVPYLLKENRNRWYLIGWVDSRQDYLTFALDRIHTLEVEKIRQKWKNDFNPDLFLQHATGIMEGDGKCYKVVLQVLSPLSKLVKLEPLHESQQIIKESAERISIQLSVNINPEFCMKILSMGPNCIIKQPASLKQQIKTLLQKSLANYS